MLSRIADEDSQEAHSEAIEDLATDPVAAVTAVAAVTVEAIRTLEASTRAGDTTRDRAIAEEVADPTAVVPMDEVAVHTVDGIKPTEVDWPANGSHF